jgi:hypothetical protein
MRCKHKAVLLPMSLAMRFGMVHPIECVYGQLVCSQCGARGEALDVGIGRVMKAPAQQYSTVWDLAKEQPALALTCRRCDHRATVQPAAGGHGHNYPLSQAKALLKCS